MANANKLKVLVTGATGQQGGSLTTVLLERGHAVRALTRDPSAPAAVKLSERGAEVVRGDFDDPPSLRRAAQGMDTAFVMGTPFQAGTEAETRQGLAAIDASKAAGVGHVVYTSVSDADRQTGIPHFDTKDVVEKHLAKSGVPYTIVAPVFFMENFLAPWMGFGLPERLAMPMPAGRKLQLIDLCSLGRFSAALVEGRERFFGRRYNVASDERTGTEIAAAFGRAQGRPVPYVEVPVVAVRQQSEDMARMFEWFDVVGYSADIAALKRDFPEVGWRSFEQWASEAVKKG